eukprot:g4374.t1
MRFRDADLDDQFSKMFTTPQRTRVLRSNAARIIAVYLLLFAERVRQHGAYRAHTVWWLFGCAVLAGAHAARTARHAMASTRHRDGTLKGDGVLTATVGLGLSLLVSLFGTDLVALGHALTGLDRHDQLAARLVELRVSLLYTLLYSMVIGAAFAMLMNLRIHQAVTTFWIPMTAGFSVVHFTQRFESIEEEPEVTVLLLAVMLASAYSIFVRGAAQFEYMRMKLFARERLLVENAQRTVAKQDVLKKAIAEMNESQQAYGRNTIAANPALARLKQDVWDSGNTEKQTRQLNALGSIISEGTLANALVTTMKADQTDDGGEDDETVQQARTVIASFRKASRRLQQRRASGMHTPGAGGLVGARIQCGLAAVDLAQQWLSRAKDASAAAQQRRGGSQVFLGGSCNPTTWRKDIAIPALEAAGITYYNPQVDDWTPELAEIEARQKERSAALLFVIDSQTRAIASILEATEYICRGRIVVLAIEDVQPGAPMQDGSAVLTIDDSQRKDLNRGRAYLREAADRHGVTYYASVQRAVDEVCHLFYRGAGQGDRHRKSLSAPNLRMIDLCTVGESDLSDSSVGEGELPFAEARVRANTSTTVAQSNDFRQFRTLDAKHNASTHRQASFKQEVVEVTAERMSDRISGLD